MASSSEPSPVSMTRQKHDLAWQHCIKFNDGDKVHMKCIYCEKVFKGGGIYRFKEHLAGRKSGGPVCQQVPPDVRLLMLEVLDGKQTSQQRKVREETVNASLHCREPNTSAKCFDSPQPSPMTRHKRDLAWKHCQMFKTEKRAQIKCNYCAKMFKGGGIHRFKEHLAGRKGAAPICEQVPPEVRLLMQQNLNAVVGKQRKKQKMILEEADYNGDNSYSPPCDTDVFPNNLDVSNTGFKGTEVHDSDEPRLYLSSGQQGGTTTENLDRMKSGRGKTHPVVANGANASSALALTIANNKIHMTMGRFLYDMGANFDELNVNYFQSLIDDIDSRGSVVLPLLRDLRGSLLKNLVQEVKNDIEQYKKTWGTIGCSILVEELNLESGKTLLNFLVYCSQGTIFLKTADASDILCSADGLFGLFKQVVEEVGAENVVQVITKGDEHYFVAGKRLMDTFPSLYWAPCAAHCIDLILEDFGKLEWINAVIEQAKSVTRFIYNHSTILNLMRTFTSGNDVVQQGVTRSATDFTTLKRMADFKLNLQTMVTSQEWMDCPYSRQMGGLAVLDIISSRSFWSSCISIIRLTTPLLQVLGMVGSAKRPAMGFVFSGMYRVKESIKKELVLREEYIVYWNIIDNRWQLQWHPPLHAAGFVLNPKFFYSFEGDLHSEILSKVFDCIERLVPDIEVQDKIVKELNLYKIAFGDLGRKLAIRARETLLPAEWWCAYGGSCPNLARLAARILSQTCSSICCKSNHISFDKVNVTRNCLERQRLRDVIFVQYNLRLRQTVNENKKHVFVEPIPFDNIGIIEDWIMQNDLCLETYGSSDWMSLFPNFADTKLTGSPIDETEDSSGGFDDFEIFNSLKGS